MRAAAFGCSASHAHAAGYYLVRNMQVFPSCGRIKSPSSPTGGKKGISTTLGRRQRRKSRACCCGERSATPAYKWNLDDDDGDAVRQ